MDPLRRPCLVVAIALFCLLGSIRVARADGAPAPARAKRVGLGLMIGGGLSLILVGVFGGVLAYGKSDDCYRLNLPDEDYCHIPTSIGFWGMTASATVAFQRRHPALL